MEQDCTNDIGPHSLSGCVGNRVNYAASVRRSANSDRSTVTLNTQRVLLVEDDKPLRVTLVATLRAEDYAVVEVGSLAEARGMLAEKKPNLIILDLGLPDGDGMKLLAQLRASGDLVPVIVLTARGDEGSKVTALDLGADDYITNRLGSRNCWRGFGPHYVTRCGSRRATHREGR
jgi:CheY-like chemotaxis protein